MYKSIIETECYMKCNNIKLLPFTILENVKAPWSLEHIHAAEMWKRGYTGEGAVIAVLDTGCSTTHPYIKHSIIGGMNFTDDYGGKESNYMDNNGHGTHICGIISAAYNRHNGMSGVAPGAKLLVLKVLKSDGTGDIKPILSAINMAINWRGKNGKRVNIIGMSFGTEQNYPELERAINIAAQNNILVVTAAGNEGDGKRATSEVTYPGYYKSVMQIGASDINDKPALFSNSNKNLDIVAPGVDILSLNLHNGYTVMSGTSMAAPHVEGAAALIINYYLREYGKFPTREQLVYMLKRNTTRLNYSRNEVGYGLLNLNYFKK